MSLTPPPPSPPKNNSELNTTCWLQMLAQWREQHKSQNDY